MRLTTPATAPEFSRFPKLGLMSALALSLLPGAAAFGVALAIAPLIEQVSLPPGFAVPVAFAAVLMPVELAILFRAARLADEGGTGALTSITSFRAPIGRRWWLVPTLFVFALVVAIAWNAVATGAWGVFNSVLPHWLAPDADPLDYASRGAVIATAVVTLVIDGILNPIVEEYYFRGFLLPRLPFSPSPAIITSAALFTLQHFWQPYNWPLIFVLEVVLTTAVVRTRSLRLGIACHVLANTFAAALALASVLAS